MITYQINTCREVYFRFWFLRCCGKGKHFYFQVIEDEDSESYNTTKKLSRTRPHTHRPNNQANPTNDQQQSENEKYLDSSQEYEMLSDSYDDIDIDNNLTNATDDKLVEECSNLVCSPAVDFKDLNDSN